MKQVDFLFRQIVHQGKKIYFAICRFTTLNYKWIAIFVIHINCGVYQALAFERRNLRLCRHLQLAVQHDAFWLAHNIDTEFLHSQSHIHRRIIRQHGTDAGQYRRALRAHALHIIA